MVEKIGGSICFQLIEIFNIIEDNSLSEEQKKDKVTEYQKTLTQEGKGILVDSKRKDGQCKKKGYFVFGDIDKMSYENLVKIKEYVDKKLTSFTCEAEMKMTSILEGYDKENHEVQYRFELSDKVYDYAMSHGKAVRGHTLVWHNHQPQALNEYIQDKYDGDIEDDKINNPELFKNKRKELTKAFLTEYIKTVGERYPNCYCWDVLNEIVPDVHTPKPTKQEKADGLRHSKWFEYLGKEFYIDVLEIARDNLPEGTKLFYNEYGEENLEKRKAIIQIIENIKKYEKKTGKILLDGIGLQSHYDLMITEEQIEAIYRDFSATGKEIQITEMDVAQGSKKIENGELVYMSCEEIESIRGLSSDKINESIWKKVFECAQKYGVKAFTGWGISDNLSWLNGKVTTMVSKDGSIKDYAKQLFEMIMQHMITPTEIGKATINTPTDQKDAATKKVKHDRITDKEKTEDGVKV